MSDTPNMDQLKVLSKRLESLLADPQTGHFTWHGAVAQVLFEIAEFAPPTDPAKM
jgi:hypothetical protein